jgi:hypothetical protein
LGFAHYSPPSQEVVKTAMFNFKTSNWWARQDLNLRPIDYESIALTN